MYYNLNELGENTIEIAGNVLFLGEITQELKEKILNIDPDHPEKEWKNVMVGHLKQYNDDVQINIETITDAEILNFITKVKKG